MLSRYDMVVLGITFLAFLFSVTLWFGGYREEGIFVGIWVPSLMSTGLFFRNILDKRSKI